MLFGSLCWLQCTPFLGLCLAVSPHIAPLGEEAGMGSRAAGKEISYLSLWEELQTLMSPRNKIGKKRGSSEVLRKSLANVTASFQGDPFSSLNLNPEEKEKFFLKAELCKGAGALLRGTAALRGIH